MKAGPDLDLKLFAHINNDAQLVGTRELEGKEAKSTIKFLRSFIEATQKNQAFLPTSLKVDDILNPLKRKLEKMEEVAEQIGKLGVDLESLSESERANKYQAYSTNIAEMIIQSKQGEHESMLLPGGWAGIPHGHALVYEFRKDKAGNLIFLIYNSGSGLDYHQKIPSKDKKRYLPVKAYRIPANAVNKEDLTDFLTELVKPQVEPRLSDKEFIKNRKYDKDRLYQNVFSKIAYLNGEEIDPRELGNIFQEVMTMGQLSGTCAEKCLHELIKTTMPDNQSSKMFILCLKVYSIEQFLEKNINNLDAKKTNQLKLAAENLSRILLKEHDKLPEEKMAQIKGLIERIDQLPQVTTKTINEIKISSPNEIAKSMQTQVRVNYLIDCIRASNARDQEVFKDATPAINSEQLIIKPFAIADFKNFIQQVSWCQQNGHHQAVVNSIEKLLLNLPLNVDHYKEMNDPKVILDFDLQMTRLFQLYGASSAMIDGAENFGPKKIISLLSALSLYGNLLKNRNISLSQNGLSEIVGDQYRNFLQQIKNNVYLESYEPKFDERLKEIIEQEKRPGNSFLDLLQYKFYIENHPQSEELTNYLKRLFYQQGEAAFSNAVYNKVLQNNQMAEVALVHLLEDFPDKFQDVANVIKFNKQLQFRVRNVMDAINEFKYNNLSKSVVVKYDPFVISEYSGQLALCSAVFGCVWNVSHKIEKFSGATEESNKVTPLGIDFGDKRNLKDNVEQRYKYTSFTQFRTAIYHPNEIYSHPTGNENTSSAVPSQQTHSTQNVIEQMLWGLRSEPDLQILSTIDFFETHLELLKKPEHAYYLEKNIFQTGLLTRLLKTNPQSFVRINNFINYGINVYSKEDSNGREALFFLNLKGLFSDYVLKMQDKNLEAKLKPEILDLNQRLEMVSLEKLSVDAKLIVLKQKLLTEIQRNDIEKIKGDDDYAFKLFNHLMNYKLNLTAQKKVSPEDIEHDKEITERTLTILAEYKSAFPEYIIKWCKSRAVKDDILQQISQWGNEFPHFVAKNSIGSSILALDLLSGEVRVQGKYLAELPSDLIHNPIFEILIPAQTMELNVVPVRYDYAHDAANGVYKSYEVKTKDNIYNFFQTPFASKPYVLQTHKKVNNKEGLYELQRMQSYDSVQPFSSSLGAYTSFLALPHSFFCASSLCWKSVESDNFLIEREDKSFQVTSQRQVLELDKALKPTGYVLLSNSYDLAKSSFDIDKQFSSFEDPKFIEIYSKSDKSVLGPES